MGFARRHNREDSPRPTSYCPTTKPAGCANSDCVVVPVVVPVAVIPRAGEFDRLRQVAAIVDEAGPVPDARPVEILRMIHQRRPHAQARMLGNSWPAEEIGTALRTILDAGPPDDIWTPFDRGTMGKVGAVFQCRTRSIRSREFGPRDFGTRDIGPRGIGPRNSGREISGREMFGRVIAVCCGA